jgi:hypothetical protein
MSAAIPGDGGAMLKETLFVMALVAPTTLIAVAALWFWPRRWWINASAIVTAAALVSYRPLRTLGHVAGDGWLLLLEFMIFGSLLLLVHWSLVTTVGLLALDDWLQRRKAAPKLGMKNEISSND